MLRSTGYGLLVVLCLSIAGYAVGVYSLLPIGSLVMPEMRATFEAHRVAVYLHVFGAAVAMALGPFQFSRRLRARRPDLHRWMGRLYLGAGVLIGGIAGMYMAYFAWGGPVARVGFALLAAAWLHTGLRAYEAARARDFVAHRRWMVRNFALTFAAVTLRLYMPASMVAGIDAAIAYPAIAWLCWVPNLVVAELWFNRGRSAVTADGELAVR